MSDSGFFVGYFSKVPRPLALFNIGCGLVLIAIFALAALTLGRTGDAEAGAAVFGGEDATLEGRVETLPYPLLRLPSGHTLLLAGDGKRGARDIVRDVAGKTARLEGFVLKRGTLDMLLPGSVSASDALPDPAAARPLGRWRAAGEICDGKCASGAMHRGTGLAHKACANLCLAGGIPPVFALAAPLEGDSFALLADAAGGPVPPGAFDLTALPVELEGDVERRGDMLVFKVDWDKARRAN